MKKTNEELSGERIHGVAELLEAMEMPDHGEHVEKLFATFRANRPKGKIFIASTVEDMSKDGQDFNKLWNEPQV